jgi:hypothetical protein
MEGPGLGCEEELVHQASVVQLKSSTEIEKQLMRGELKC